MVSFSCDACQNVFTKPKVERHLQSCNTSSVSCIDCGVVFNLRSVRGHTSCITEEQKFGPKGSDVCTQSFCGICQVRLNGAVHAVQHYDSKKHCAAMRRRGKHTRVGNGSATGDGAAKEDSRVPDAKKVENKGVKVTGLAKVIKKALRGAKKQRLKRKALLKAVSGILGDKAPEELERLVDRKIRKSKQFVVRKDRITLAESTDE